MMMKIYKKFAGCLMAALFLLTASQSYADAKQDASVSPDPMTGQLAQEGSIRVTGLITDDRGNPVVGATVSVKDNPAISVTTNALGEYTISVPGKTSVLTFNYLGYASEEAAVGNRTIINTVMHETAEQIENVVITAFGGATKKESVVGAITSLVPERLNVSTSRSLSNSLGGVVSGILAVQRSGEPGYDNSTFWIRGISTFQSVGGNPMVLVDGIERDLNSIDLEEIESFSVLKDAAASAVYGVRGANGVILINTKRGVVGKPRVTLKSEFSVTQPVQLPDYIGAVDYMTLIDDVRVNDNGMAPTYMDKIAKTKSGYDPDLYPDTNWIDAISKDAASNQRVTLEVNGGTDVLRYSFVAAFYNEQGILKADKTQEWDPSIKLQRYNVRSNVDVKLSPTTQMRFNIGGYLQDRNSTTASVSDIWNKAFKFTPFAFPAQYSTGELPQNEEGNPWAMASQVGFQGTSASKIESLFSLEQDFRFITKGLKAKVTFSFDRYSTGTISRSKTPQYYGAASGRTEEGKLILAPRNTNATNFLGSANSATYGTKSLYVEAQINYDRTFGEKHAVSAMLLANRRQFTDPTMTQGYIPQRTQGLAGRTSYIYGNRYIVEFNFGYNGSENFAPGERYGFFPSIAAGWVISEEPFMASVKKVVSNLKLRASYGLTGNSNLAGRRFAYIATINTDWNTLNQYGWGADNRGTNFNGMAEGDFAVPDLQWEIVKKLNLGFEFGLYNGMFELQVDLFQDKRDNIFMERASIPATAGFVVMPWSNNGKVTNRGLETQLKFNKSFGRDFYLSIMGNFTWAHNEITGIDEAASVIGTNRARTGHPITQLRGQIAERLFTEADFKGMDADGRWVLNDDIPVHTFSSVRPGDIKYVDVTGDGFINAEDVSAIGGTSDPEIVYGFGATMRWKNLDFGFLFQGVAHMWKILSKDVIPVSNQGAYYNVFTNYEDRWTVDNPRQDVFYPRLNYGSHSNNEQASTWWLKKMDFIRLKNVELGFSFPQKWMDKIHLGGIRVFVRGTNLLTFSEFKLWDPELSNATGAAYPAMKSYSGGLEIKF